MHVLVCAHNCMGMSLTFPPPQAAAHTLWGTSVSCLTLNPVPSSPGLLVQGSSPPHFPVTCLTLHDAMTNDKCRTWRQYVSCGSGGLETKWAIGAVLISEAVGVNMSCCFFLLLEAVCFLAHGFVPSSRLSVAA